MRSGRAFTQLIEFTHGNPTTAINWAVSDIFGDTLDSGDFVPDTGAVSAILTVSGASNLLTAPALVGGRELVWSYFVDGVAYGGEARYTLEAPVPFPVTPQGVRDKLGAEAHELSDDAIPLMDAYLELANTLAIDDYLEGTSREIRLITNALEAMAGLAVLPTLQLRLAASEDSGTNAYARFSKVDWDSLEGHLRGYLAAVSTELGVAVAAGTGLFTTAGPSVDPITGA